MFYLVFSILTTLFIILLFKVFGRFQINTFQAIATNYIVAAIVGFTASTEEKSIDLLLAKDWIFLAIGTGCLFILTFYLMASTVQKVGVAPATVASKMSLIIPVTVAFCFYGDEITVTKIVGIAFALLSVVLTNIKDGEKLKSKNAFVLPLLVFIFSGIIDSIINYAQINVLREKEHELFFSVIMASAGTVGLLIITTKTMREKTIDLSLKTIVGGAFLGLLNIYSLLFLIKALDAKLLEPTVLFPINNLSILVLSSLLGLILFKEKLNKLNQLGLLLAIISICLIANVLA